MLKDCPECKLQVSDKAMLCPHCGYPFKPQKIRGSKRPKLPNGFGQITELKKKNLRKPFRVMVTVGTNEVGRPICKLLKPQAFFETYNEAYAALVEYNRSPYDLKDDITLKELYERWSSEYYKKLSDSRVTSLKCVWKCCGSIYNIKVHELRTYHIKDCIANTVCYKYKLEIKILLSKMLDYAIEYELIDKNCARSINTSEISKEMKKNMRNHMSFTDEELQILWNNVNKMKGVDILLIQCYGGWRPKELGLIEVSNVNLEDGYIIGGLKTEAGMNRIVPIHPKIKEFVKKYYDEAISINSKYLFNITDKKSYKNRCNLTYSSYKYLFLQIIDELGLDANHKPHDGRKCFVSKAKKYNVDEYAIKYIVGHSITDLTERVYTERETSWLISEMQKIK